MPIPESSDLLVQFKDGVEKVILNRPNVRNALRKKTLLELDSILDEFAFNSKVSALIITAEGDRVFCAGGDLKEMQKMGSSEAEEFARLAHRILEKMQKVNKPILAAVNGLALGAGCDLVTACDVSIASDLARFGMPSINVGLITPFGGTQRFPFLVGPVRAKYLFFTGEVLDANTAFQIGLVSKVVKHADLLKETETLAANLARKAPHTLAFAKQSLNSAFYNTIRYGEELEIQLYAKCFTERNTREAIAAFLEKRKPEFRTDP